MGNCIGLSSFEEYATPIGPLPLDTAEVGRLSKHAKTFMVVSRQDDLDEHSVEMQLPLLRKIMGSRVVPIVPLFVSRFNERLCSDFASALSESPDLASCGWIISSDFCHWGRRFQFHPEPKDSTPLHEFIESLDRRGISLIESMDSDGFESYLHDTRNTICGRYPISLLLFLCSHGLILNVKGFKCVGYSQSDRILSPSQSSVSYAAIVSLE